MKLVALFAALAVFAAPQAFAQDALNSRTAQSGLPLDGARAMQRITHASLSITVDPALRRIEAIAFHTVTVSADLTELQFDLDPRFVIASISVNDVKLPHGDWSNPDGVLTLRLPEAAKAGDTLSVWINYGGRPHEATNPPWEGGFVWAETPDGQPWIATAVQGEGCDLFWPCIDHPAHRIDTLDLMVTVPDGLVAAANGRLFRTYANGNGTTTYHWQARDPSNYGISLQIGPYEVAQRDFVSRFGNTVPLKFWHLPADKADGERLLGELERYVAWFESAIGPYPFWDEKAGVAQTPHLGMEHQTINAYGNKFTRNPLGYDELLFHEFAHEWFGNQITHADLADLWLHEGFATYMQVLYLEAAQGRVQANIELWNQRRLIVGNSALVPLDGKTPDYMDSEAGWGTDIYAKGAWVLHSLRSFIGDEAFFATLTRFVYGRADPAPGNFAPLSRSTEDFIAIAEEESGRDLGWFFDTYLRHAELPKLKAVRDGEDLILEWQTPSAADFEMPVELKIDGYLVTVPMIGGRAKLELESETRPFQLDPHNTVLRYDEAVSAWREARKAESE